MPRSENKAATSYPGLPARIVAGVLVVLTLVLFLIRYLPRQTVMPLIKLLPGAESFMVIGPTGVPNPDAVPELTNLAAALLVPVEIAVLALAGWTAWETCKALKRIPPYPFHISLLAVFLFAGWCCAALLQIWMVRAYIGAATLPVDSIGGIILESLLIAGATVAAGAGWARKKTA